MQVRGLGVLARSMEQSHSPEFLEVGLRDERVKLVRVLGWGSMEVKFIRSLYVNHDGKGMIRNACVRGVDIIKKLGIVSYRSVNSR